MRARPSRARDSRPAAVRGGLVPPRWLAPILARPGTVLAAALLAASLAALGLGRLAVDNSPRAFFARDGGQLAALDGLRRSFGGGPTVRLAWSGPALWTEEGIEWLERSARDAASLEGVAAADGPLDLGGWWDDASGPAEVERRLRADPLVRAGGWIGAEGDVATLLVELRPGLSRRDRHRLLDELERLAAAAPGGLRGVVVGLPMVERAMDRSLDRLVRRIFPAIALLCGLLLLAACREPLDAALPLATVAVAEAALAGLMGWAGVRLNLVTSVLLPIVFVLGLVVGTHLQMRFRAHRGRGLEPAAAAAAALGDRLWAISWAGVTTAAAFGSFALSRLPAVRSLGLWTAAGVGLVVAGALLVQLPAMALLGGAAARDRRGFDRCGRRLGAGLARRARRRRGPTLAALALIGGLAAAGLPRLALDGSLLDYFAPDHPVATGLATATEWGVGAAPAELVLRLPAGNADASFRDPDRLERLAELSEALGAEPSILGAIGAGDLFRAAGRRLIEGGPGSEGTRWLVLGLLQTEPAARRRFERMVTPDGGAARITLLVPVESERTLLPLLERAAARARRQFPEAEVAWTGDYPLVQAARRELLATTGASLGLTALVVLVVLALLLRSPRPWAAAAAANLWPVLLAGGLMGWAGIPLDSTTVMIAAVALGIAVDDTLHTLGELRARPGDVAGAIGGVAPAQLLATVILGLGFAGCGLSDFLPVARFGLVTAAALVAALAGDWLLLPALLGGRPRQTRADTASR